MTTVSQLKAAMARGDRGFPAKTRDWYLWCQALVGWSYYLTRGVEPTWYGTAKAAWLASPDAVSKDPYAAPVGALHWFTAGHPDYDVKISLGGGRLLHAYRGQDEAWPGLVGIGEDSWERAVAKASWVRDTYLGWTYGFGPGNAFTLDLRLDAPAPIPGNRRIVKSDGAANRRTLPTTEGNTLAGDPLPAGDYGDFNAFTQGQTVSGNNIWFRGAHSGHWFWSGSFTDIGTHDLVEIPSPLGAPPTTPPPTVPPVVRPPIQPINGLSAEDFTIAAGWIRYESVPDLDFTANSNAEAQAYYEGEYGGDYRREVLESHAHWWSHPAQGDTHDGIVAFLRRTADLGANLVTSAGRVTSMIPLSSVAFTTGARSMKAWTTENDPLLTGLGYRTLAFVHYLVESKNPRLRAQAILLHKDVVNAATGRPFATACSLIDVPRLRSLTNDFHEGRLDPATGLPPVTAVPPVVSPPVIVPPVIVEPGPVVVPPREPGDSGTPISSDPRARLVVLIAGLVTIAATVLVILAAIRS